MSKVSFSTLAYCKMVAHAAKYPHCEVNGLLVAENSTKGDKLVIVDTVPLFHQCLHVSPMSEIALMQIDQSASTCNMYIAGYYLANETLDDLSYDKPAHKIMDKIVEHETDVCMVVINNRLMELNQKESALLVHTQDDGKWKRLNNSNVQIENVTLAAASAVLQQQLYNNLVDFDNHLDNLSLDWLNTEFSNCVERTSGHDMGRRLMINKSVS
ncbi:ER membrane protein complex subunit 8/9 homolog [Myzus persicae]|uniref:ER membrane protein complex subunit 8/9 homolog n=1 Tax=Myzus persicae TaxID=13164 RepID=UPI000B933456|nr:ER membrane protein complex subunit 8/9 homolog [Myzus persicae]XP_022175084.1 ER membrane protein complex subunit 8/9 homolog [Myzus persicae]